MRTHSPGTLATQAAAGAPQHGTPPTAADLLVRLRLFAGPLSPPTFYVDCSLRYRFANPAYLGWLGRRDSDIVDRPVGEVEGSAEERRFDGYLRLAMQGRSVQFEREIVVADGSTHWVRISYTPDVEPDGSVAGVLGVVHDLSEAHSTAQRAAELELQLVMQHVPTPIAYVTHDEVYRYVNLATETWLRRRRDQIIGHRLDEVLPAEVCERVRGCLAATRAGERTFYESRFTWADGSAHHGRVSFAPDHDARGIYRGAYVVLTDLTEHKQIEEALAASEKHFRLIIDGLPSPVVYVNKEWKYVFVNREFPKWMARRRDELEGQLVRDVVPPQAFAFIEPYVKRAFGGEHVSYERDYVWADGSVHPAMISYVPHVDDDGQVAGVFAVLHDLTEIRAAQAATAESERHFRLIADELAAPVFYLDQDEVFRYVNREHPAWLGKLSPQEVVGRSLSEVMPPDAYRIVGPAVRRALSGERSEYERRFIWRDGSEHWGRVCYVPDIDPAGHVRGTLGVLHDLTDVRHAQQALAHAHQVLSSHVENSPLAVIEWDPALRILRWSGQAQRMFGLSAGQAVGRLVADAAPATPDDAGGMDDMLRTLCSGVQRRTQATLRHVAREGRPLVCEWYSSVVVDENGRPVSILSLVEDVTQRVSLEAQLRAQATRDGLTGLANRRLFEDRLGQAIAKARRSGDMLAVLFIDLDGFKQVNDSLGHDAGDSLLVEVAHRFGACVREGDTLARLGGDEFTVIIDPLRQKADAGLVARKLLDALAPPFELSGTKVNPSASIGIGVFPQDAADLEALLRYADAAMYEAKRAGKGRFSYAGHP
ncbi:two-component system, sensor histidine kinase [Burkholderiaceae bacterium]|nr:two-component system, sensor histidine kinase [Burkholderiaceae bacterium]